MLVVFGVSSRVGVAVVVDESMLNMDNKIS